MPSSTCSFCGTFIADPSAQRCPNCQTPIKTAAPPATVARVRPVLGIVVGALFAAGMAAGVLLKGQPAAISDDCDSAVACRKLGVKVEGKGPQQDVSRAVTLYEKACAGGDV